MLIIETIVHLLESLESNILIKIAVAVLLSSVIGIERELKKKPIGLKTSAIIAAFSCLLTVVSVETAYSIDPNLHHSVRTDPLRLAAQIVSGIGFLGAGAILQRNNEAITGITTAAMIWGSASIGIAVGANFIKEAIFTALIVLLIVEVVAPALQTYGPKRLRQKEGQLSISITDHASFEQLIQDLLSFPVTFHEVTIKKESDARFTLNARLTFSSDDSYYTVYHQLSVWPHVETFDLHFID